jgi:purine-cytosine permease-like protein
LALSYGSFFLGFGISFWQATLAAVLGTVLSFLIVGFSSLAGKKSNATTMVLSRAAFGVWGNVFPAVLMLLVKIVWTAALVIFGARILSPLISNQPWFAVLSMQFVFPAEFTALLLTVIPVVVIASLVAGFGGITLLRAQQLAAIFSLVGIAGVGYFVFTSNSILDLQQGEMLGAAGLLDLAILSFALFGFTVFSQSGDFARKLPVETPGAKVFFLSFVSTLFIPLIVGEMGVLWVFMD